MKTQAKNILLVDDDPVVLGTLEYGLVQAGYRVTACLDAMSALSTFTARPPDLAIVDIDLPDIPGTKLAASFLRVRYRPIIILSTHNNSDWVQEAIGSGVFGYLVKPLSTQQLIPSIETALVRFQEINYHVAQRFGKKNQTSNELAGVIDQLSFGIIVIDHQHRIIHCNRLAENLLADRTLLTNASGKLRTCTKTSGFELMLDVAVGNKIDPAPTVVNVQSLLTSNKIQVWATPLPASKDTDNGAAILVIVDPTETTTAPPTLLKALYGLTAKESKLVQALLDGQTIQEYGRRCFVSPNTVRTPLKSIYRKTQTNRQADLIRMLSRLFACIPAEIT